LKGMLLFMNFIISNCDLLCYKGCNIFGSCLCYHGDRDLRCLNLCDLIWNNFLSFLLSINHQSFFLLDFLWLMRFKGNLRTNSIRIIFWFPLSSLFLVINKLLSIINVSACLSTFLECNQRQELTLWPILLHCVQNSGKFSYSIETGNAKPSLSTITS